MKKLLIISFILFLGSSAYGQREVYIDQNPGFKDRVFFGGGLNLGGGSDSFYIGASPMVGYMLTEKWSAGLGINYTYVKYNDIDVNDNQYGFLVFTRYNIFRQFFLQAQYDYINYTRYYIVSGELLDERDSYSRVLAGGGISQPIGARGAINFVAMYDLSYSDGAQSPYGSPWVFQIYFSF